MEQGDFWRDLSPELPPIVDVPRQLDMLPDGTEVLVIGDPQEDAHFAHLQGDNPFGYLGDCGIVSCEGILHQFGIDVSEAELVEHAIRNGLCTTDGPSWSRGGTTVLEQVRILSDYEVPAHYDTLRSLEELSDLVQQGHGIILEANAGVLWNDPDYYGNGRMNHAVVITGVALDSRSSTISGFYINDSGTGEAARFVDAATMQNCWLNVGGNCVVTTIVR